MDRRTFGVFFAITLLAQGFCLPSQYGRIRRQANTPETTLIPETTTTVNDVDAEDNDAVVPSRESVNASIPIDPSDDEDDVDDLTTASSGGGSSVFSIFNLLGAILPGSSSASILIQNILKLFVDGLIPHIIVRRQINDIDNVKPSTFQRQENSESNSRDSMESESDDRNSNQELDSEMDSVEDEYDEPEGDGQGGGILGLLAGLSGGEDGQSDLGSLLATVSGIIGNLSGDGIDLNALIASGIGLFVGLLSEGNENPGSVIASYFLTSLDTITGGGSTNNGAFIGNFLSKLIQGASAAIDPDASSEENQPQMKDSAGFYSSLLMAFLGNMSKGSSGSSPT